MAGMGFDAHMLDATNDTAKHIGWLAYVAGAAQHLRDRPMRLRITLDDQPAFTRRPRTVIVGNVGRLQGGVRLLNDAQPDDGLLDVAVLSSRTLQHWAALGWGVLRRKTPSPGWRPSLPPGWRSTAPVTSPANSTATSSSLAGT
ncbi:diacylglycerol/lipid kinase family protein [Actinoplanes sp. NPDC004185]